MGLNLEELGFTKEQLQDRVVDRIVESLSHDDEAFGQNVFKDCRAKVVEFYKSAIDKAFKEHVLPRAVELMEGLVLEKTTKWGEPKSNGEKWTFKEYIEKLSNDWLDEKVDFAGKAKGADSYNWSPSQTRISHMIHEHLHYTLSTTIKNAIGDVNKRLANGIAETCKIKLNEIVAGLKVDIGTGR